MPINYEERFQLAGDGRFTRRLQMALWVASSAILAENVGVPNHAARVTFARANLRGQAEPEVMRRIAIRVTAHPAMGAQGMDIADATLQTAIDTLIDELTS